MVLGPDRPGTLQAVDLERLDRIARESGAILELTISVGDALPGAAPLVRVRGGGAVDDDDVRGALTFGTERTMDQDPAFGFRQLVDIADRALSPGINDPTTATQVIDQVHDLLRRLAVRHIPSPQRVDDSGALRVIVPAPDWADHVDLAVDEIRISGGGSIQVVRALRRMLDDLETVVPDGRRAVIRRQRALLPNDPARD